MDEVSGPQFNSVGSNCPHIRSIVLSTWFVRGTGLSLWRLLSSSRPSSSSSLWRPRSSWWSSAVSATPSSRWTRTASVDEEAAVVPASPRTVQAAPWKHRRRSDCPLFHLYSLIQFTILFVLNVLLDVSIYLQYLSLVASSQVPTAGFHRTKIGLSTTSSLLQSLHQVDVQSRQRIQRLWTLWDGSVAVLGHRRRWLVRRRWWRSGQSRLPGCVQPSTFSQPQSTRRRRTSGAVVAKSSPVNAFSRWLGNRRKSNHPSRSRLLIVWRNRKQKWRHTVADIRLSMFTDTGSRHAVGRWR